MASEASYVGIFIKYAQNGPFGRVWEKLLLAVKQCYQTGQLLIGQKWVENAISQKVKCDIPWNFQTLCLRIVLLTSTK